MPFRRREPREAGSVPLERRPRGFLDALVARQAEVVVRAEHEPVAALHPHDRPGFGLDLAEVRDQVLAARELDQLAALVVTRFLEEVRWRRP